MLTNLSKLLKYLASLNDDDAENIPALDDLGRELGINRAALREEMAVARALGLVTVKPRIGTRKLPYTLTPAITQSLGYAILEDRENFNKYSDLRAHVESAYFHQAVSALTPEDIDQLEKLVWQAWEKLRDNPPQIPHQEHRALHLLMYNRLDNIFALGILEAYWEAYETVELNIFTDYNYLTNVWQYHSDIVQAIKRGDYDSAHRILLEHTTLIAARPNLK